MSGDIVERLRALALHDDLSIAFVAADEIEQLTRERDEARAEVERLRAEKEALYASIAGIERAAAGAIYSQESIHAMALYALKPLMERGIEPAEAKP